MTAPPAVPLTDHALAQRLERAEARSNTAAVEARARLHPDAGAAWVDVGGTRALFDGVASPLTQTFGLGLFAPPTGAQLDELEAFYGDRGAAAAHEVSPLADPATIALLGARGYRVVELTAVLHRPVRLATAATRPTAVTARPIAPGEEALWAQTSALGWGETPELAAFMREYGLVSAHSAGAACFVAELDGQPIGAGAVAVHDGVALLAGASTLPAWRGRGAQGALLAARLRYAAEQGCDLAMMGALPGSTSQQNAERQGFRIAYTRLKWQRAAAEGTHGGERGTPQGPDLGGDSPRAG